MAACDKLEILDLYINYMIAFYMYFLYALVAHSDRHVLNNN